MEKFNKYLYTFIFSMLSLSVFILRIEGCPSTYLNNNDITNFFSEIFYSLEKFDIIYVTLFIFIFYFYSKVFFNYKEKYENIVLGIVFSIIFALITVVSKAFVYNNSLTILYSTPGQVFKTVVFFWGYYLIYYSLLKKVLTFDFNKIKLKKKGH